MPARPARSRARGTTPTVHVVEVGGETQTIRVWLPRGYAGSKERYPVLYLLDGQNLFDSADAFGGTSWRAGKTAQRLIDTGRVRPMILVGVDNNGSSRVANYTPIESNGDGGGAPEHGALLTNHVKPFVDANYRTRTDRQSTGIGGSSLGGLFALWLGLTQPEAFGHIAAMSPTAWWGDEFLLRFLDSVPAPLRARVWIDVGSEETDAMRTGARKLAKNLARKSRTNRRPKAGSAVRAVEFRESGHDEDSWARRFPHMLTFLFPLGVHGTRAGPSGIANETRQRGEAERPAQSRDDPRFTGQRRTDTPPTP